MLRAPKMINHETRKYFENMHLYKLLQSRTLSYCYIRTLVVTYNFAYVVIVLPHLLELIVGISLAPNFTGDEKVDKKLIQKLHVSNAALD